MPITHEEAFKRGMISRSALQKHLRGKKGQPSKMANFEDKSKTDEYLGHDGPEATDKNQINTRETQKLGTVGTVSKGRGAQQRHGDVGAGAINEGTGKSTSPGTKITHGKRAIGVRGGGDANGGKGAAPYYGGPNNNRNG